MRLHKNSIHLQPSLKIKSVSIPEPCTQDFNAMRPVEGGNFCQLCEKTVVDFTKKSNDEIKAYLLENHTKKICGRVANKQLHEINSDYTEWENQHPLVFQSKFVYALLLVFGMTLFQFDAAAQDTLSTLLNPIEQVADTNSTEVVNVDGFVDSTSTDSASSFVFPAPDFHVVPEFPTSGGTIMVIYEALPVTLGFMVSDFEESEEVYAITTPTYPGVACGLPAWMWLGTPARAQVADWNELLPPSTIILDFKLPFNTLENMLGDKRLTAKAANATNPYIFDLELNSELTDDLRITVLAPNGKRREICNRYALPGIQRFSIDLTHYPAVPYLIMIQQGTLRKSLFIRRPQ